MDAVMAALLVPLGLLSTLFSLPTPAPYQPSGLAGAELQPQWGSPWMAIVPPDPALAQVVERYLNDLDAAGWDRQSQGLWLQVGQRAVAQHQGQARLSAASLTKLATTLAALRTQPAQYQFETLVGVTGPVQDGVVLGDVVVQGGGDPLYVWEDAIALANQLQQLGIRRIAGDLVVTGAFTMNFEEDTRQDAAQALAQALDVRRWSAAAHTAYANLPPGTPQPAIQLDGRARLATPQTPDSVRWIIRHHSLPLVAILKAMNIYSNNVMADQLADWAGGIDQVMATVAAEANLPPGELQLVNGSGLGMENQMSARVAVALMAALQTELATAGYSIADVLPVAGVDVGTLTDRQIPATAAVKTGTLNTVSALAGVLPTADQGPVWFAIINSGWAIGDFRDQQDILLAALQDYWGPAAVPPALAAKVQLGQASYWLGDPARLQVLVGQVGS